MKISKLKPNPNNPRVIKDEAFRKLVNSIKEFPKMMALRPIVTDNDGMVLGGNQRLKALKELGYKDIPEDWVKKASDLTEEEKRRFIVQDNVESGEWDWTFENDYQDQELEAWGLDLFWSGHEVNSMTEDELNLLQEFDPYGNSLGMRRVVFIFDDDTAAQTYLDGLGLNIIKNGQAWQVNMSTRFTS